MILIPYDRYQLTTGFKAYRNREKIVSLTEKSLNWESSSKPFHGTVENNHFKIIRSAKNTPPYFPIIEGDIQDDHITFAFHLNVKGKIRMFFGAFALLALSILLLNLRFYPGVSICAGFLAVSYIMSTLSFKGQVNKAKLLIDQAFQPVSGEDK